MSLSRPTSPWTDPESGLASCPACDGFGYVEDALGECATCNGDGVATLADAERYIDGLEEYAE